TCGSACPAPSTSSRLFRRKTGSTSSRSITTSCPWMLRSSEAVNSTASTTLVTGAAYSSLPTLTSRAWMMARVRGRRMRKREPWPVPLAVGFRARATRQAPQHAREGVEDVLQGHHAGGHGLFLELVGDLLGLHQGVGRVLDLMALGDLGQADLAGHQLADDVH